MISFQCREVPDSFLLIPNIWESFNQSWFKKPKSLHEFGNGKIIPCDISTVIIFTFDIGVQFCKIGLELFTILFFGILKIIISITTVDELDVVSVKISGDSRNCSQSNLLISISSQELSLSTFMNEIDTDSVALGNKFVPIDKVGKGDGRVLFLQFRLNFVEPFFSIVLVVGNHFILYSEILHKHSDSFRETSDFPITELNFAFHANPKILIIESHFSEIIKIMMIQLSNSRTELYILQIELMIQNNNKLYDDTFNRAVKKGQKGLIQYQKMLQNIIHQSNQQGFALIRYYVGKSVQTNLTIPQKNTLIQLFQYTVYVIKLVNTMEQNIPQIIGVILRFFNDPSEKVRLTSITSIYNIFIFLQDECLAIFTRTFKELPCVIVDPSPEVRRAAIHLNSTMKTLLNNAILDKCLFDINDFMGILAQNFLLPHPVIKQFLIDWINTTDEIRQFQISVYLPLFLKKLFLFLVDDNENVRMKAKQCLNGFIDSFQQFFTCSKDQIGKRFQKSDTENILLILIKIIEESIIFQVSSEIDIDVLAWLQSFSNFLKQQIELKVESFLSQIFKNIFYPLLKILLQALSSEDDKIRKKVIAIHNNLQIVYPHLQLEEPTIQKCVSYINGDLKQNMMLIKSQIQIKWMTIMLEQKHEKIVKNIEEYTNRIIQKICQQNSKYCFMVGLLEKSIIITKYFTLFIRLVFRYFLMNKHCSQNHVLCKILNLPSPSNNFLVISKTLNMIPDKGNNQFKWKIADILFSLLISQENLSQFRHKIKQNKIQSSVIHQLYETFLCSKSSIVGLCFLLRKYRQVIMIVQSLADQVITSKMLKSFSKVVNCLLCPSMYDIVLDIQNDEIGYARNAYLSLIMVMPVNKNTSELNKKIKLCNKVKTSSFVPKYNEEIDEQFWKIYSNKYKVQI